MSTDTHSAPTYNMSEIPEFILRSKKPELTLKELEYQCQKLGEENHQLQLRILGVNELARLLQDRNELVAVLKERNKRLEMSLVRLENRCATFERQLKSQKNTSMPSIKPGQSPFIPGPSPKILEGLMQENLELKKTVNSLKKKGSSGYLEAVKTTQLEEFIEQQKLEIDQLHGQINNLTASAGVEDMGGVSGGGGMSLPASVSDSGPLRRQLLKMQQTMSVKDRFCTLLSQQVTELQKKLSSLQGEKPTSAGSEGDSMVSDTSNKHVQETQPPRDTLLSKDLPEHQKMLEDLKSSLMSSKGEIGELKDNVKKLGAEKEDLQEKLERTSQLYSTLLSDNSDYREQVESLKSELSGRSEVDGGGGDVQRLRSEIRELQKTMDGQVEQYTKELKSKNLEMDSLRVELEEANLKFAQTDSMLFSHRGELRQLQYELKQRESELKTSEAQVFELEESLSSLNSHNADLQRDMQHYESEMTKFKHYSSTAMLSGLGMKAGGITPTLIGGITPGLETVKDSLPAGLKCRNAEKPVSTSNTPPQQHPPQQHVSQPHATQEHMSRQQQQHGQLSKPPGPLALHIPPPPLIQGSRTSPGPQPRGHHYVGGNAMATPPGSAHTMGRPLHSNTTPTMMGPTQFNIGQGQGNLYSRQTSAGPHMRSSATMPISTFSGTPSPRVGTPGAMGMGGPLHGGGAMGARYASTPGVPRMPSSSGPPPPLPPRSMAGGYAGQGQVFGVPHANFPPLPRPQHTQPMFHRQDHGYPYHPETRDRPTGSTSPHPPPHDNLPYSSGGNGGPNNGPQPPHY